MLLGTAPYFFNNSCVFEFTFQGFFSRPMPQHPQHLGKSPPLLDKHAPDLPSSLFSRRVSCFSSCCPGGCRRSFDGAFQLLGENTAPSCISSKSLGSAWGYLGQTHQKSALTIRLQRSSEPWLMWQNNSPPRCFTVEQSKHNSFLWTIWS